MDSGHTHTQSTSCSRFKNVSFHFAFIYFRGHYRWCHCHSVARECLRDRENSLHFISNSYEYAYMITAGLTLHSGLRTRSVAKFYCFAVPTRHFKLKQIFQLVSMRKWRMFLLWSFRCREATKKQNGNSEITLQPLHSLLKGAAVSKS